MSKSIYDAFKTSSEAENDGQWFNYGVGPLGQPQRFKLARKSRSNKAYARAVQRHLDKYGPQLEARTMDEDTADDLLLDVFCRTILVDWSGIPDPEDPDKPLPYSVEAAKELMRALPALYEELNSRAENREYFLAKQSEELLGN